MKSFLLGALLVGSTLFYADHSYGTLRPCDMLAKERARDAMDKEGLSIGLLDLAIGKWKAHQAQNLSTFDCVVGVSEEWWFNAKQLVGIED